MKNSDLGIREHFKELMHVISDLGDPCEMQSQCYLKSGHLDRVNCENGFCKCENQYQQTPDLDCLSGNKLYLIF